MFRPAYIGLTGVAAVFILSVWSIRPLTLRGFFPMHDDTQVGRVVAMGRALQNGQFPVRWVADLGYGYGYPLFNFYAPLPYYVGGALYATGMTDALTATKFMFAAGILLSGLTMFWLVSRYLGTVAGVVAGVMYVYAPYHAVQIYVRGAVGEFWAAAFFPLFLFGIFWIFGSGGRKEAVLGITGLAGTILSHTLFGYASVVLTMAGCAGYLFFRLLRERSITEEVKRIAALFSGGLGLSAFFWLPAFAEMSATSVAGQIGKSADYLDHFVCLGQLWSSPWGFGGSEKGCMDGFSFKLGKEYIVLSAAALALCPVRPELTEKVRTFLRVILIWTALSLFLVLSWSVLLWKLIPFFAYMQYPWRFLSPASLGLSVLSAAVLRWIPGHGVRIALGGAIIAGVLVFSVRLFIPQYPYTEPLSTYTSAGELRFRVSKISDEYLPPGFIKPKSVNDLPSSLVSAAGVTARVLEDTGTRARIAVQAETPAGVVINRTYFPGWRYEVNGTSVTPAVVHALPRISVPQGTSIVSMQFTDTPVRTIGNLLSVLTVVMIVFIYGKKTIS